MTKLYEVSNKYNNYKEYTREFTEVGRNIPRLDGPAKVTGKVQYTDDLVLPRMVYGKILRSPHAHANIKSIDYSEALKLDGVLGVITGEDCPIAYGIVPHNANEHALAVGKVRNWGEGVAAVAAIDEATAEKALELIKVEYEVLEAIVDPREAVKRDDLRIHEDHPNNIAYEGVQVYGDPDKALAESDYVIEKEFYSSYVTHAFIEPQAAIADFDPNTGKLHLYATCQVPHYTHQQLAKVLEMPMNKIRITVPLIGGGFGGKGVASQADFCSALLSRKIGRPVKITYERSDVFATNNGRHPCYMKFKMGFDKNGKITAVDFNNLMDGGAYSGWGIVVLFYTASMVHIPYAVPNVKFDGKRIFTNKPTCGAQRGLGGVQPRFAMEQLLDEAAEHFGMTPYEIKKLNAVESGYTAKSMMYVPHSEYKKCLDEVVEKSEYMNKIGKLPYGKGIGLSGGYYISGTSYTLYLSYKPHTVATIKIDDENGVTLYCGATDIGQGVDTVMAQMAAETLGVKTEDVKVVPRDTQISTFDLGTFASRLTFATGWAIRQAAEKVNAELFPVAASMLRCRGDEIAVKDGYFYSIYERHGRHGKKGKEVAWAEVVDVYMQSNGPLSCSGQFTPPRRKGIQQGGNIGHSPTFGFSAQVAEVDVDLDTGKINVVKITEAGDCGQPINPMSVEGQVHGSIQMGLGQALYEEMQIAPDGRFLNPSLHDYKMPTIRDMPKVDANIVEAYDPSAPYGGKESGEGPIQPTIPAIFSAVYDAIGVRFTEMPLTPEKVLNAIKAQKASK
ncbi:MULTISPECIES: xanthine dehydrogenase family protein molybdopterin-binding subunit [unclassified Sedimentibacter]|uniref:xanthine dehydrogenase family protein molybdopterin-binding subunit n=1 Tax=unclassified Sedimentibacter TaxID=2649220 RepID=UPI0027E059E0|nr:xanthine dehydrogenase family protein molybdopterin-binding subunit [Sedimentibacter sp. MB35-C1]WMJ78714.1 xanthine dehydrogenase family protein molybdopterin-binding subunit [Sedimentibacter sp. MB35-C1]